MLPPLRSRCPAWINDGLWRSGSVACAHASHCAQTPAHPTLNRMMRATGWARQRGMSAWKMHSSLRSGVAEAGSQHRAE